MRTLRSIVVPAARGWRDALCDWRLGLLLVALSTVPILPAAIGFAGFFFADMPTRPAFDGWLVGPTWREIGEVGSSHPALLGNVRILAELSRPFGPRSPAALLGLSGLGGAAAAGILIAFLLAPVAAAAILARFSPGSRRSRPGAAASVGTAIVEWSPFFLGLSVPFLVADIAIWALLVGGGGWLTSRFLPAPSQEGLRLASGFFVPLFGLVAIFLIHRWLDFSRISAFLSGERSWRRAIAAGWTILRRAPARALGIPLACVVPLVVILASMSILRGFIAATDWGGIVAMAMVGQVAVFLRQVEKAGLLLAEARLAVDVVPELFPFSAAGRFVGLAGDLSAEDLVLSAAANELEPDEPSSGDEPSDGGNEADRAAVQEGKKTGEVGVEPVTADESREAPPPEESPAPATTAWPARITSIDRENEYYRVLEAQEEVDPSRTAGDLEADGLADSGPSAGEKPEGSVGEGAEAEPATDEGDGRKEPALEAVAPEVGAGSPPAISEESGDSRESERSPAEENAGENAEGKESGEEPVHYGEPSTAWSVRPRSSLFSATGGVPSFFRRSPRRFGDLRQSWRAPEPASTEPTSWSPLLDDDVPPMPVEVVPSIEPAPPGETAESVPPARDGGGDPVRDEPLSDPAATNDGKEEEDP
jgi:hypothetical protein